MVKTNRPQREALARLHRRMVSDAMQNVTPNPGGVSIIPDVPTYREFRATVQPGPGCIMVRYASMWVGVEPDGYAHS